MNDLSKFDIQDRNFLAPRKIVSKRGAVSSAGEHAKALMTRAFLVSGSSIRSTKNWEIVTDSLEKVGIKVIKSEVVKGEPTPSDVDNAVELAFSHDADGVIAIGGGSAIDTGKAVAGLLTNERGVEKYLEGVGIGLELKADPEPFIAIPTTAGAGAEATKNAVVTDRQKGYKRSFRDNRLIADVVIIDPELTLSLPWEVSANCGMDAICQLVESIVSKKRKPFTTSLAAEALPAAIEAIKKLKTDPNDMDAREAMSYAATVSGLCLANSGLGGAHGFAAGLGGLYDIPHGLICAVTLPHVTRLNVADNPEPYIPLASVLGVEDSQKLSNLFSDLNKALGLPESFRSFGTDPKRGAEIVENSKGSSMSGNPSDLPDEVWVEMIRDLL